LDLLKDQVVISAISDAWRNSLADEPDLRHEEGGYIVLNEDRSLSVERWSRGSQSRILPPSLDPNGGYNGKPVLAAFHTHPNPAVDEAGREWEQGPSASDRRWHGQMKLRGFVVGHLFVYEIDPAGSIIVAGKREEVLSK
jgi:hypothetical protein